VRGWSDCDSDEMGRCNVGERGMWCYALCMCMWHLKAHSLTITNYMMAFHSFRPRFVPVSMMCSRLLPFVLVARDTSSLL